MSDYLVRALGFNGKVRAFAARTTETVGKLNADIIHGQRRRQHLVDP